MLDITRTFLDATNAVVAARIDVPPRAERLLPVPEPFMKPQTANWLARMTGTAGVLWRHQSLALDFVASGANVVLGTGTASGKSLGFQAPIIDELLHGNGTALLLYPQKALAGDQFRRWQATLEAADLNPSLVGEINGDITMQDRDDVLQRARIISATPDTMHAWLLRHVASPAVQRFLKQLRFVGLDEAHAYDGVFGSNSAYFLRRLRAAAARWRPESAPPVQFIAATATIANPAEHLELLTGLEFVAIDECDNGAPCFGRTILHVEGPEHGAAAEKMLADYIAALTGPIAPKSLIAFLDSRQAAEKVTCAVGAEDVIPYRSGYEATDRRAIERRMRDGTLRAAVSTSALELGIDVPQFIMGLNLGVPLSRKGLRQRIGRVGRSTQGLFVVIAPGAAFAQLGLTFREFIEGEVEPCHLYLENRYVQFQQARCLIDEVAAEDGVPALPESVEWPSGFEDMFRAALPGAVRSADLDAIAAIGSESPHLAYPLRRIGDVTYALRLNRGTREKIGTIDLDKALREAYPGATYRHRKQPYRVVEWRTKSYEHVILLEPCANATTHPMMCAHVNFSLERDGIIDDRHLSSEAGSLAEVAVGVHQSVVGYSIGSTSIPYREASKTDSRLNRKQQEYSSTGIAICIDAPWFKGSSEAAIASRRMVARALEVLLTRAESIGPSDIRSVYTGIGLLTASGPRKIDDAIVLFDTAQGGLRLTSPLFDRLPRYLEQLAKGATLALDKALLSEAALEQLTSWYNSLRPANEAAPISPSAPGSELIVFAPDSEVALRYRGSLLFRKLLEPQLITINDEERLMYSYEAQPGVHALVAHDRCEPVGQNWSRMFWNPASRALREMEA